MPSTHPEVQLVIEYGRQLLTRMGCEQEHGTALCPTSQAAATGQVDQVEPGAIPDTIKNWVLNTFALLYCNQVLGVDTLTVFTPAAGLDHTALFWWLTGFTILTGVFMTLYFVPSAAIAAELPDDYCERTSVMAYRHAAGWAMGVLFPLITYILPEARRGG